MEGNSDKINIWRVIIMGGAFINLLIGSGFTTGQEIMQYFVSYGAWGYAVVIMMFLLFLYVGCSFVMVGAEQYVYSKITHLVS